MYKSKKSLIFVVKISLLLKLQNITDINLCKKVRVLLFRSKFLEGKVSEYPKIYDVIKGKRQSKICTQVVVHLLKGMYDITLNDRYEFLK